MNKKRAIILRGPSGTGKSTVGNLLKQSIQGSVHIDVDLLKHMISFESSETRSSIAHNVTLFFLKQLVRAGYSTVIIDEIFRKDFFDQVTGVLKKYKLPVQSFFLMAEEADLIRRDRGRIGKTKGRQTIQRLYEEIVPFPEDIIIQTTKRSPIIVGKSILKLLK